jgi:cytochrome b561
MSDGGERTYSRTARRFHWWTVAFIAVQVPVGLTMVYRGNVLNLWDAITNALYDTHKLLGCIVFFIVLARLGYRLRHGAPAEEPTLPPWQRAVAAANHWGMYVLLLIAPLVGWFGVQLFPALSVFGLFSLPAVVSPDNALSTRVLALHAYLAFALVALVALHIGAALFHFVVRRDGVMGRMIPRLR